VGYYDHIFSQETVRAGRVKVRGAASESATIDPEQDWQFFGTLKDTVKLG